ncbi:MAG: GNAT family N-acetyltransferase [Mycobacteriales bacterium]
MAVFGDRGEASRCWCTYFRMPRREWAAAPVTERRDLFHGVVAAGREPGLLAYADGEPVGWVSVAPREDFLPHLERTRVLRPAPGDGVWSVLCFVVRPGHRRQGVATALLAAAVRHARARGARAVEGHPIDDSRRPVHAMEAYVGVASRFAAAGFTEIDRRGARPVYRLDLSEREGSRRQPGTSRAGRPARAPGARSEERTP